MAIPVRQNLVAISKYSLKCPYPMTAQYITVHNTFNDDSADAEIRYMISNDNSASFHIAVDDKEVVQGIPFNRNAWHCGDGNKDGNRKSIGVEICYSKSGGERYKQAEALAIRFIAQLLKERGWGIDRVRKHQDWSGEYCPQRILDEGRWQAFLSAVVVKLARLCAPKAFSFPAGIYYISAGGYAGIALGQVHDYLFKTGHNFDCKRGADGTIVFLIGAFDTSQPNFKDCEQFLLTNGHIYELIPHEKTVDWKSNKVIQMLEGGIQC